MLNPFAPQQDPDPHPYVNLKKKTLEKVEAAGVNDQIFQVVQNAFEAALRDGDKIILLSRPERKRLFAQILRAVLEDMIRKLDERSGSVQA